jgi:hypothetical protein
VQAELEAGDDAEVAAAAAQRPEQLRVAVSVGAQPPAVGAHDLDGQQVVDRQPVLADQVADPAGQGDPPDPDRGGVAEPGRQAALGRRGGVLAGGQAGLGPGGARLGVDLQRAQAPKVEHDPPVGGAVPGRAVAAAADRQLLPALVRQGDDRGDVVRAGGLDDQRRVAVKAAVEDLAGLVVAGVVGSDHPPVHLLAQPWDRDDGLEHDSSMWVAFEWGVQPGRTTVQSALHRSSLGMMPRRAASAGSLPSCRLCRRAAWRGVCGAGRGAPRPLDRRDRVHHGFQQLRVVPARGRAGAARAGQRTA